MAKPSPAVSRVLEEDLIELVYDKQNRRTALLHYAKGCWSLQQEICLASGETLVPYAPSNNLIATECIVLPERPMDHGDKGALLADIRSYLHRYVDVPQGFEDLSAHYVLLTWVYDAFNECPYLRFRGDFGSGKTRALLALGLVSYKAFFASGASTVSPIFHVLNAFRGTLVLDEADLRFSGKTVDLVKILNNGSVRGLPVLRTLQNSAKEFNPAAFDVFGPKIVAMRGQFADPALESRFISQDMGLRPLRDDIPIQLPDTLRQEAAILRNKLLDFRLKAFRTVGATPAHLVEGIMPRLNQTAAPLLALIDDSALRDGIAQKLGETESKLRQHKHTNSRQAIFQAVLNMFGSSKDDAISLSALADHARSAAGYDVTAREIGYVLRQQNVILRKSHGTIVMPRSSLAAAQQAAAGFSLPVE